jgi:hypothetical protein
MLVLVILEDDIPVMRSDWLQQTSVSRPAHSLAIRSAPALDSSVMHFHQAQSCNLVQGHDWIEFRCSVCLSFGELLLSAHVWGSYLYAFGMARFSAIFFF